MNKKFVNADDSIARYFKDIRKSDLLTPDEEVELAIRIQEGDEEAIEQLVNANLKFVISIAKEYQGKGLPLSDLISEGNYGLIKSALRFDHARGYRFISYAVHWIRQAIMQSLNDNARTIRLPSNVIQKMSNIRKGIDKFESENGRKPIEGEEITIKGVNNSEEIYEYVGFDTPDCSSLNHKINEEGDEMVNLISDDSFDAPDLFEIDNDKLRRELEKGLEILDNRERDIIRCYFGYDSGYAPMTLEDIGEKYGLTKERIRQIKEKAIRKLRFNIHGLIEIMNE